MVNVSVVTLAANPGAGVNPETLHCTACADADAAMRRIVTNARIFMGPPGGSEDPPLHCRAGLADPPTRAFSLSRTTEALRQTQSSVSVSQWSVVLKVALKIDLGPDLEVARLQDQRWPLPAV